MGKSILVIDDDPEVTMIIQEILKTKSYDVVIAHDGLRAMEKTNEKKIDLILMDLRLPIFSGFWFCDAFRRKPETKNIPIIVISALTSPEDMQKAYKVGASSFLKKPFRSDELLEVVSKTLSAAA